MSTRSSTVIGTAIGGEAHTEGGTLHDRIPQLRTGTMNDTHNTGGLDRGAERA